METAIQGHLPNLRFLHIREEHRLDSDALQRFDPKFLREAKDSVSELQAAVARALPLLETVEFLFRTFIWNIAAAIRWTRRRPWRSCEESGTSLSVVTQVTDVTADNAGTLAPSKASGKISKFLQIIRKSPKTTAALAASQSRTRTKLIPEALLDNEEWSVEEFDKYMAMSTPWPDRIPDVTQFVSVLDRYSTV